MINLCDLGVAEKIPGRWCAQWSQGSRTFYVVTHIVKNGKKSLALSLHRLVTGCVKPLVVDHLDYNGLNNRRTNLNVCTQSDNIKRARRHRKPGPNRHQVEEANIFQKSA